MPQILALGAACCPGCPAPTHPGPLPARQQPEHRGPLGLHDTPSTGPLQTDRTEVCRWARGGGWWPVKALSTDGAGLLNPSASQPHLRRFWLATFPSPSSSNPPAAPLLGLPLPPAPRTVQPPSARSWPLVPVAGLFPPERAEQTQPAASPESLPSAWEAALHPAHRDVSGSWWFSAAFTPGALTGSASVQCGRCASVYNFTRLFASAGSSLLHGLFSTCCQQGLLSRCAHRLLIAMASLVQSHAAECAGFSSRGPWAQESWIPGSRAQA